VQELRPGDEGQVVLDATPFYAESGGQVGDRGVLAAGDARFVVADTRKLGKSHVHVGRLEGGAIRVGDQVEAVVDHALRQARDSITQHAPAARGPAPGIGRSRHAEGSLVTPTGCDSILALLGGHAGGARRDRAARQCRDPQHAAAETG